MTKSPSLCGGFLVLLALMSMACAHGPVPVRVEQVVERSCDSIAPGNRRLLISVHDVTGAPLPGATLDLIMEHSSQLKVTDAQGMAEVVVAAGVGSLDVQLPGFLPARVVGLHVSDGCRTSIGVRLEVDPRNVDAE